MRSVRVDDIQVLVLAGDSSPKAKGALFERFIGRLLADEFGFEEPRSSNLNVTSDGIELDVVSSHRLTRASAVAECKAYTRAVKAKELTNFYGKLMIERFSDPNAFGLLCALPRLTPEGEEKAREIEARDRHFKYISAIGLHALLEQAGLLAQAPQTLGDTSDPAVLVTEVGLFRACIVLDSRERTPTHVAVWGQSEAVPQSVIGLLTASEYALGMSVLDASPASAISVELPIMSDPAMLLTPVIGSSSDFEYQLPASPRYFVGRQALVKSLGDTLDASRGSVTVLNAQSGWGKSSLALKLADLAERRRGVAIVLDTRTADEGRYVVEVLRSVGNRAAASGVLTLPTDASWASLESALATFRRANWGQPARPIVIFFDQFENVFRNFDLTRLFRDLALGVRDVPGPLMVGFAWKTDLVGWTEGHPFQLRDDIRGAGQVLLVEPFGAREVDVILSRVGKEAGVRLLTDLRSRLRAYSQGLPWLLKKLADHVLRELRRGETQEDLLAESLNVVSLFAADLAELSPNEQTVLLHVARFAPVPAIEVTERFGPTPVQSLVDRRLLVQVGDRLDTYWDTFRDFLNTGNVPIEESWILRQTPNSVRRLLPVVMELGGDATVQDLTERLGTSDKGIFNLSRELRLLGLINQAPNRVQVVDEVLHANDQEGEMRKRVSGALRRHRAYSALRGLAERSGGQVTLEHFSRDLPNAFPAVAVAKTAWESYARAFLFWMEYAGLVVRYGSHYRPATDPPSNLGVRLLEPRTRFVARQTVPHTAPGPALQLLRRLQTQTYPPLPTSRGERRALSALISLGIVAATERDTVRVTAVGLVDAAGNVNGALLQQLLASTAWGNAALQLLASRPDASPSEVGAVVAEAVHADWADGTAHGVGKHVRGWARMAGVAVSRPAQGAVEALGQGSLF